MQQHSAIVADLEAAARFLTGVARGRRSSAVLVQVYSDHDGPWTHEIESLVRTCFPTAVVAGCSSAGAIAAGRAVCGSALLVVISLEHGRIHRVEQAGPDPDGLVDQLDGPDLRGILLLHARIDPNPSVAALAGLGVPIFGGGAALLPTGDRFVFGSERLDSGLIAVAFSGAELAVEAALVHGWAPVGPRMRVTRAERRLLQAIDGAPAVETWRRYLGIGDVGELDFLEFPLLVEREGEQVARTPARALPDGSVQLLGDIHPGEVVRFGYLDLDATARATRAVAAGWAAFAPDTILAFSGASRRLTLEADAAMETHPYDALAPTAGVFLYGEVTAEGAVNGAEVVVAFREGPARPRPPRVVPVPADRRRARHLQVTSRLLHLASTLAGELEEANRALAELATHDALTGLLNRRALEERLEQETRRSARHGYPIGVVLFDLDHFKAINDSRGHAAGDHALQVVAAAVEDAVRGSDAVFRYGGEEFVVLLPDTPIEGAVAVAEHLRDVIRNIVLAFEGRALPSLSASFGVAGCPAHGRDVDSLLRAADAAVYLAKSRGRDRVEVG